MRYAKAVLSVALGFLFSIPMFGRQVADSTQTPTTVQRDPQAVAILHKALSAVGGSVPADSVATGTVTIVAGTKTENGTIRILTRGTDQTSEQIQLSDARQNSVIYSRGRANEVLSGAVKPASMELSASSQSPAFPLPLLLAAFNNADVSIQYIGEEILNGSSVYHLRFFNTYASNQGLQPLSDFTTRDLWVDAVTGLPQKLGYLRRDGGGAAVPQIRMEIFYSDWRTANGVAYPYRIEKSWNGTPWTTISIQNVVFQTGLTDSDFPVSSAVTTQAETKAEPGVQP